MRTTRRQFQLTAAASLPVMLGLVACGGGTPAGGGQAAQDADTAGAELAAELDALSHEELVARAEEEGEVTVYSFTSRIAQVEEEFEKAYPGIDLIGHDISATEQITRLAAEAEAGTPSADVAYISDAPVVLTELLETGVLTGYVPERVAEAVPEEFQQPLLAPRGCWRGSPARCATPRPTGTAASWWSRTAGRCVLCCSGWWGWTPP